jgi:hypothetical protein
MRSFLHNLASDDRRSSPPPPRRSRPRPKQRAEPPIGLLSRCQRPSFRYKASHIRHPGRTILVSLALHSSSRSWPSPRRSSAWWQSSGRFTSLASWSFARNDGSENNRETWFQDGSTPTGGRRNYDGGAPGGGSPCWLGPPSEGCQKTRPTVAWRWPPCFWRRRRPRHLHPDHGTPFNAIGGTSGLRVDALVEVELTSLKRKTGPTLTSTQPHHGSAQP